MGIPSNDLSRNAKWTDAIIRLFFSRSFIDLFLDVLLKIIGGIEKPNILVKLCKGFVFSDIVMLKKVL